MENLTITTVQTHLYWENIDKNLAHFSKLIASVSLPTDVIILPEMFITGFTMHTHLAEHPEGKTTQWLLTKAREKQAIIMGSIIMQENAKYYNRLICAFPDGSTQYYNKRHLFSFANENQHFTKGKKPLTITYKGWKITPLICYDLRFPVWSRNTNNTHLYIYVANWPAPRINAWNTLLQARAIENVAYVAGVNRIGTDVNNMNFPGHSAMVDFKGNELIKHPHDTESIHTQTLNAQKLLDFRKKFPALSDSDTFTIDF